MRSFLLTLALAASNVLAHEHAGDPKVFLAAQGPHKERMWYNTLPGDGGTQVSFPFLFSLFFLPRVGVMMRLELILTYYA